MGDLHTRFHMDLNRVPNDIRTMRYSVRGTHRTYKIIITGKNVVFTMGVQSCMCEWMRKEVM
jgi:hypothetical protein